MADLPQSFLDSMKEILGEDYEAFLTGFDGQRQYGLGEYFKDELGGIRKNCSFFPFKKSYVDFKWIFLQRRGCYSKASFL